MRTENGEILKKASRAQGALRKKWGKAAARNELPDEADRAANELYGHALMLEAGIPEEKDRARKKINRIIKSRVVQEAIEETTESEDKRPV